MRKKLKTLTFVFSTLMVLCSLASAQETDSKKLKAEEILKKAKDAVYKTKKPGSVTSLSLNYKTVSRYKENDKERDATDTTDLHLISDKIRQDSYDEYATNTSNTTLIVNGGLFERNFEVFVDGKKLNAIFNFPTPKETEIKTLKRTAWIKTFPIFLESSLLPNLEFSYVGIAESKDGRASVIQTTAIERTYQLFFDEKTNLLLMMTEAWNNKEGNSLRTKYFFSDYQQEEGLFFARKINYQSSSERVGIGETVIKTLKLEPAFKSNFFEVKQK